MNSKFLPICNTSEQFPNKRLSFWLQVNRFIFGSSKFGTGLGSTYQGLCVVLSQEIVISPVHSNKRPAGQVSNFFGPDDVPIALAQCDLKLANRE